MFQNRCVVVLIMGHCLFELHFLELINQRFLCKKNIRVHHVTILKSPMHEFLTNDIWMTMYQSQSLEFTSSRTPLSPQYLLMSFLFLAHLS